MKSLSIKNGYNFVYRKIRKIQQQYKNRQKFKNRSLRYTRTCLRSYWNKKKVSLHAIDIPGDHKTNCETLFFKINDTLQLFLLTENFY